MTKYRFFPFGCLKDIVISVDEEEAQPNMLLAAFEKNRSLKTPFFPYWCSEEHAGKRVWAYSVIPVKKPGHFESQKRAGE